MCSLPTSFLLNIQSRVKQEVDMPQIQNLYESPLLKESFSQVGF